MENTRAIMSGYMETDKPLVSVVVPIYRAEAYLKQCVDSLLGQSYDNLEILLTDDGSPDGCGSICDAYEAQDPRVTVIHQENRGVSAARNAGVSAARGEYIAFVDADDWVEAEHIGYLLQLIRQETADIAVCRCETKAPRGGAETVLLSGEEALRALLYQKLFDTSPWSKLYRADIVKETPFPENMFFEDLAVVCQMFGKVKRVAYSRRRTYHYHRTLDGTMNGGYVERLLDEIRAAEIMYEYVARAHPSLTPAAESRRFSACCQVLLKLPKGREETAALWERICKARKQVLTDPGARGKNRAAALASYLGEDAMRRIWKIVG